MIKFLHTNDFHGFLPSVYPKLLQIRDQFDLYLDSGDAVKFGNLAIPVGTDPAWEHLDNLKCDASVLGNREVHYTKRLLKAKLAGLQHPILCANMVARDGSRPFANEIIFCRKGVRVGVFGVMIEMTSARKKFSGLSEFLWENPIAAARGCVGRLKDHADLIVGLTHIGFGTDKVIADKVPGIDIILGGHSHEALLEPILVNGCFIAQAGSHGRFAGAYEWDGSRLSGGLISLK